ncbi:PREDICTED: serine carboxypeptidase-like 2 isoform X2 [Ipomoea nil]|uniref:serine carboxypeptidase-like 2 isoform X2 n=1 Tax=Ipomoea nil TaxID=35883 RepID=UPI0009016AFB|nr:PREDICTED: serine carboxypeptidase-like 2 isoform X2 [Ipomoea nil]
MQVQATCHGHYIDEHPRNAACQYNLERVSTCTEKINQAQILERVCSDESLLTLDVSSVGENLPQHWCRENNYLLSSTWANNKVVQKALHVYEKEV